MFAILDESDEANGFSFAILDESDEANELSLAISDVSDEANGLFFAISGVPKKENEFFEALSGLGRQGMPCLYADFAQGLYPGTFMISMQFLLIFPEQVFAAWKCRV